ncbi:unnamed protein product, partial [Mycena citricolor]
HWQYSSTSTSLRLFVERMEGCRSFWNRVRRRSMPWCSWRKQPGTCRSRLDEHNRTSSPCLDLVRACSVSTRLASSRRGRSVGWNSPTYSCVSCTDSITPTGLQQGRVAGDDDTARPATQSRRDAAYNAITRHKFYMDLFPDKGVATQTSRCLKVVVFDNKQGGKPVVVNCITVGKPLYLSHGLFGRATRAYRVVLEHDLAEGLPRVYVLKDSWRMGTLRPEVDCYMLTEHYYKQKGLSMDGVARCVGTIDLSAPEADLSTRTGRRDPPGIRCQPVRCLAPVSHAHIAYARRGSDRRVPEHEDDGPWSVTSGRTTQSRTRS